MAIEGSKEIICFDQQRKIQKHKEILSRNEYNFNLNSQTEELKETIDYVGYYLLN